MAPRGDEHPLIDEHAAGSVSQTPTNANATAVAGIDLIVPGVMGAPPRRVSIANH